MELIRPTVSNYKLHHGKNHIEYDKELKRYNNDLSSYMYALEKRIREQNEEIKKHEFTISLISNKKELITESDKLSLLVEKICNHFNIHVKDDIYSSSRRCELVFARNFIFFLLRYVYDFGSLSFIGKCFNRHHATVIHGINSFKQDYHYDTKFKEKCNSFVELYMDANSNKRFHHKISKC